MSYPNPSVPGSAKPSSNAKNGYPALEDRVYHHIEGHGRYNPPLSQSALALERAPKESTFTFYHCKVVPVTPEEVQGLGPHSACHADV